MSAGVVDTDAQIVQPMRERIRKILAAGARTDPRHLCLTCKLAEWEKTPSGRLHRSGDGKCGWKPPRILIPAVKNWRMIRLVRVKRTGGQEREDPTISRRPSSPITSCEVYEARRN